MKTGEVIRMYRKNRNLTQEEMASRLGVTAPAVNKWENNVSFLISPFLRPLQGFWRQLRIPFCVSGKN